MRLILTFDINKKIEQSIKFALIYWKVRKFLILREHKIYISNTKEANIFVFLVKSIINTVFLQLTPNILYNNHFLISTNKFSKVKLYSKP